VEQLMEEDKTDEMMHRRQTQRLQAKSDLCFLLTSPLRQTATALYSKQSFAAGA
jgi:hypothetical protein